MADRMLEHPPRSIALSAIVLYELKVVTFLPFGQEEADVAGALRAELEQSSTSIGHNDILIAATALANRTELVTNNTAEFSRVAGLELVDWF